MAGKEELFQTWLCVYYGRKKKGTTDTFFSPVSLTSQITSCCNLSVYVNYRQMGSCRGGPDTERSGSCSTAFYKNDIISHNDQHLDHL